LFTAKLVRRHDAIWSFVLVGAFTMAARGTWSATGEVGREGTISGEFDIDADTSKIVRFRAYSDGLAWGGTDASGIAPPPGRFPLKFALVEAEDDASRSVFPVGYPGNEAAYRSGRADDLPSATQGASLLKPILNKDNWYLASNGPQGKVSIEGNTIRVDVMTTSPHAWDLNLGQHGIPLEDGQKYRLQFRARASEGVTGFVGAGVDHPDWHDVGLNQPMNLTTAWKSFSLSFTASRTDGDHHVVPNFMVGARACTIWFADVSLEKVKN
jgi:hypothetical protein